MANLRITLSGSTLVPDPSTKNYTVSDADLQILLNTIKTTWVYDIGNPGPPPTNQQLLLKWVQQWIDDTIQGVQRRATAPPPPIDIS